MQLLETMTQKGEAISPDIIHSLGIQPRSPNTDFRTGIILIASAISFFTSGVILGEEDAIRGLSGVAMFALLIGATNIELWVFIERKEAAPFK